MPTRVGVHEAKTHLSEYLNRAAYRGERIVIARHGKPVAALVGLDDLRRLEAPDAEGGENEEARKARFYRAMEEKGLIAQHPTGDRISVSELRRRLIRVEGPPVSEQIIAERR